MTPTAVDEALRTWVWSHRDELVEFVRTLVRERSVLGREAARVGRASWASSRAPGAVAVTGPPAGNVLFSSVIDEECGGNGMRAVVDSGLRTIATLIGEPTDLSVEHGGIGVIWAQLTLRASGGHAASVSSSPVDELFDALHGLRELEEELNAGLADHPYNLNVGEVHAGVWPSSVPDRAVARVRLGFGPELSPREAQTQLTAAVTSTAPNAVVEFLGFEARPYWHEPTGELADAVGVAYRQLRGGSLAFAMSRATCDARFVDGPAYCFGPRAGNIHGVDEWVDLDSVIDTAAAVAIVARAWCSEGETVA